MADCATCFMLEITPRVQRFLRRYCGKSTCAASGLSYHNARTFIDVVDAEMSGDCYEDIGERDAVPHDDPRWPKQCACGYVFLEEDTWQLYRERVWTDTRTGKDTTIKEADPGAMWNAYWAAEFYKGPDGRSLQVKLPTGHIWSPDNGASNCGLLKRDGHFTPGVMCWQRVGEPPKVTCIRQSCPHCGVGGGSIGSPGWHGYLTNGELTTG